MRRFILFLFLIGSSASVFGQSGTPTPASYYDQARVVLLNGVDMEVEQLRMRPDTATFMYAEQLFSTSYREVKYFQVEEGKATFDFGLFMVGMSLGYLAFEAIRIENEPDLVYRDDAGIRAALLVSGSFAVGCGIGSLIPKRKKYRPSF
jgi:hypothetical protein